MNKIFTNKLLILSVFWIISVCTGMYFLVQYNTFPCATGNPPSKWPPNSSLVQSKDLPTLILFAHPKCPCTRATINELAIIMAQNKNKVNAYAYFYKPLGYPDSWTKSDTWNKIQSIPGVTPKIDTNGKETKLFKAQTSGHVLLYNKNNDLIFSGGITSSRGHEGNNTGRKAVVEAIKGNLTKKVFTNIYGCKITNLIGK